MQACLKLASESNKRRGNNVNQCLFVKRIGVLHNELKTIFIRSEQQAEWLTAWTCEYLF